jgi:polar amino acid transport system substrate-binding protein
MRTGATGSAPSSSKLNEVLKRGTVIVGTGSTNPPWHFEDEKGSLQGFDIEMARLLAKGLFDDPAKVQFVRQASDARVPNLQTGQGRCGVSVHDRYCPACPTGDFSIPYYREGVGTLLHRNSPYGGALDLAKGGKKVKVSILQNVYAESLVHVAIPQAEVMQFDSVANAVLALDSAGSKRRLSMIRQCAGLRARTRKIQGWQLRLVAANLCGRGAAWDPVWLHFVNTVLHEGMTGVEFDAYASGFEKYFGVKLAPPPVGFPVEFGVRHS